MRTKKASGWAPVLLGVRFPQGESLLTKAGRKIHTQDDLGQGGNVLFSSPADADQMDLFADYAASIRYLRTSPGSASASNPTKVWDGFPGPRMIDREEAWRRLGWNFYPSPRFEK